jgi:anti-sigma factor RsiW
MILVTDVILCAYVDNELPDDQRAAIEILAVEDPEVAERIVLFRTVTEMIKAACDVETIAPDRKP